jgi:hypothetical protein
MKPDWPRMCLTACTHMPHLSHWSLQTFLEDAPGPGVISASGHHTPTHNPTLSGIPGDSEAGLPAPAADGGHSYCPSHCGPSPNPHSGNIKTHNVEGVQGDHSGIFG